MALTKPHELNGGSEMDPCLRLDGGHHKAKFAEDGVSVDTSGGGKGIAKQNALHRAENYLKKRSEMNRRQLIFVLAIVAALLLLFIVVVVLAACWPRSTHAKDFPVCRLPACLQASAQVSAHALFILDRTHPLYLAGVAGDSVVQFSSRT
jgi:hypothetical protein